MVDALYLADSAETASAEWYRHLAERMIPPLAQMPRELWTWQVKIEVADLSTPERLAAVGLSPPIASRQSWPTFQQLGELLWKEGWAGLLAASAARPEGKVLCLFRDADGVLWSFIARNWRGRPLVSHKVIVNLIAATTTRSGLEVYARLDERAYEKKIEVSDAELAAIHLEPHEFHPEWNYTIRPSCN